MFQYVAILILIALIGFSGYKINEHKDDKDVTKLALYSTAVGVASVTVLFVLYGLLSSKYPVGINKDQVIDDILEDFLNPTIM
jgi:hypothetical protein